MDWMLFKEVVCIVLIWSLPETKLSLPHLRLRRWYTQIWTYRLKQKFFWNVMRPHFPLTSFTLAHVPYECKFNLHKWKFNQNGKKTFTCYKTYKGRIVTDKYLSKQLYIIIRILYMTGTKWNEIPLQVLLSTLIFVLSCLPIPLARNVGIIIIKKKV